jgi:hypothetical protein
MKILMKNERAGTPVETLRGGGVCCIIKPPSILRIEPNLHRSYLTVLYVIKNMCYSQKLFST